MGVGVGVAMLSGCTTVQDPDLWESGTRKVILLPVTDLKTFTAHKRRAYKQLGRNKEKPKREQMLGVVNQFCALPSILPELY